MRFLVDWIVRFSATYERIFWIVGAVWFWAGVAIYARFIELPDMPESWKIAFFWSSVGANALWWGFIHPQIGARRKALEDAEQEKLPD